MGLVVRLYDIVSPNKFNLSIGTSPYGYFKKIEGPEVNGAWPSSNVRDYMSNPICMTNDDPTVPPPGSGTTCENVVSELEFDTEYWIKLEDNVNDIDVHENDLRSRYVIHNIYIHDSKAFDCYDRIEFGVDLQLICPTPTPQPTLASTPNATPVPTPTPTGEVIDDKTEINIFFDNSGSMGGTEAPLNTMASTILKNCLLPFYNNDSALYDSRVKVILFNPPGPVTLNERGYACLATTGTTSSITKVINLAFQDESTSDPFEVYVPAPSTVLNPGGPVPIGQTWNINRTRTTTFNTDITTLRNNIDNNPPNYILGEYFQVATGTAGQYLQFQQLLQAVELGQGQYTVPFGLSDKLEIHNTYNVVPGPQIPVNTGPGSPQYYADLIITAINNLGYSVPPC